MPPAPNTVPGDVDLAHTEPTPHEPLADDRPPPQQCGRCRLLYDSDPTLYPPAQPDWWLCPPCRAVLLGRDARSHHAAPAQQVGDTNVVIDIGKVDQCLGGRAVEDVAHLRLGDL